MYGSPGIMHRLKWILGVLYRLPEKRLTGKCVIMCTVHRRRVGSPAMARLISHGMGLQQNHKECCANSPL